MIDNNTLVEKKCEEQITNKKIAFVIDEVTQSLTDCYSRLNFFGRTFLSFDGSDDGWILEDNCRSLSIFMDDIADSIEDIRKELSSLLDEL